ncbi:MAG: ATP-binding protein [Anaerococcus sp.]|nr:ATP-binding protein [Anaerococcus sp.]
MNPNKKASQILEQRRKDNKINQARRIEEIYKKIPQIRSINRQIKELGFSSLKLASMGMETREKEQEINKLSKVKEDLLRKNGYPRDYMDLKYHHGICKDTGFIGNNICSCRRQLIIDQKYDQSNIKTRLREENFASFNINLFSKNPLDNYPVSPYTNIQFILRDIRKFIDNFAYENGNIYIYGDVGRGKTFLVNAIAKEILDKNFSVVYMTSTKLFKFLNDYLYAFEDRRENLEEKYQLIFTCDLLIIDDLGAEASRASDRSNLFDVVNERMNEGKPIIFSSNLDESALLDFYGSRIFSRIMGNNSRIYEIYGEDLRLS